jgi:hypothetical protein
VMQQKSAAAARRLMESNPALEKASAHTKA